MSTKGSLQTGHSHCSVTSIRRPKPLEDNQRKMLMLLSLSLSLSPHIHKNTCTLCSVLSLSLCPSHTFSRPPGRRAVVAQESPRPWRTAGNKLASATTTKKTERTRAMCNLAMEWELCKAGRGRRGCAREQQRKIEGPHSFNVFWLPLPCATVRK